MTIIINGKAIEIPVGSLSTGNVGVYSVTQAEYDAIPESDRVGNLYIITDAEGGIGGNGGSSGSSMEVYDGEERVIGTWFGKTLYRRVVVVPGPTAVNKDTFVTWEFLDTVDVMVSTTGFIYRPSQYKSYVQIPNNYAFVSYESDHNGARYLNLYVTAASHTNFDWTLTFEYTKKEDA